MAMAAGALGTTSRGTGASTRGKKRRMAGGEQDSRTIVASNPFDDEPSTGPPIHLHHHQVSFAQGLAQVPPPPLPHHQHHLQHQHAQPQHPQQHMMLMNHNPHHDFHSPQPLHMSSPGPPPPGYGAPSGPLPPESPMLPGGAAPVYSPAPPTMAPRMSGPAHMHSAPPMMHQPPGPPPPHQQLGTPPHMVCPDQLGLQPPPPPPMHHQSPTIGGLGAPAGTPSPRPPPMYAPSHFQPASYGQPEQGQPSAQLGANMVSPPPLPPPQQVAGPSPNMQQPVHMALPPPSHMVMQDQMAYQQQQQPQPPPHGQPQMLVRCAHCGQPIYQNEPQIMCRAGCESSYHQRCSGLSELACELLLKEKAAEWVCQQCTSSRKFPAIRQISQEPDCRQPVW